jgi:uncharacterized protein
MRPLVSLIIFLFLNGFPGPHKPREGYEQRIRACVDTLRVFDTHEHMFNPEALRATNFLDFSLLLHQNSYDDLLSAGMPRTVFNDLFNKPLSATDKWNIIKPYWNSSFNTTSNRVILSAIRGLYNIEELSDSTVEILSSRMKSAYQGDWFNHVLKDICKIDYLVQEEDFIGYNSSYVRYTDRFSDWITIKSKYTIDSLAACQLESICTFDNFVNSLKVAFIEAIKMGMIGVKVNVAYERSLDFERTEPRVAKKVFKTLMSGDESFRLSFEKAKPLQDYMLFQLIDLANQYNIPVLFHTGLQAGSGNIIKNSDPTLLTNLFQAYPDVKFVLYHGSYPFGGVLSVLAKTYKNVYLDMNWTYSISPSYAARYLAEWLETVPVSKIMAFGGDQRCVENTYGELIIAKEVIAEVLIEKVRKGYLSESEAKDVARMILHDNGINFYKPQS